MTPDPAEPSTSATPLRDLVLGHINQRWEQWAEAHPHLAQVIDRMRLVESTVARLRDDPEFAAAMRQADLDEAQLAAAVAVIAQVEKWIGRLLPL